MKAFINKRYKKKKKQMKGKLNNLNGNLIFNTEMLLM